MSVVREPGDSGIRSRRLAVVLAGIGATLVAVAAALALSGYPSRLVPSVGFRVVTAFVLPGLALSLLVDAVVLVVRDRSVTLNELTVLRVVAVVTGIALGSALLEALWTIPGLEILFLGVYVTMGAVAILVFFALVLTVEIAVQSFRARRVADR